MRSAVTIVVPCYNEARRFKTGKFREYAARSDDVRFLLVNDGSSDETGALLDLK